MKKYFWGYAAIILLVVVVIWKLKKPDSWPIEIGVKHPEKVLVLSSRVINPRFPKLNDKQFKIFIEELKKNIKNQLEIDTDFIFDRDYSDDEFFADFISIQGGKDELLAQHMSRYALRSVGNVDDLYNELKRDFRNPTNYLDYSELLSIVSDATNESTEDLKKHNKDVDTLLKRVASIHLEKYSKLKKITLEDGKPIFDEKQFNEFPVWASYLKEFPFETFILTNQPLISFSEPSPAIHSSLRGGITAGFNLANKSKYGSVVVMSTFPFLFPNELLDDMRDFEPASEMMPAYLAAYTTHEFGHSFAYWGHYFQKGCIMNPASGLKIKAWYEETRNKENCKAEYKEDFKSSNLAPFEER